MPQIPKEILQLATAFTGSAGFAVLFHTRRQHILPAALGGLFSWGVYLFFEHRGLHYFAACLIAAAFAASWSELMARLAKTPATVFFISASIPLIPGSALYTTMSSLVAGRMERAWDYGVRTALYMTAIATGVSLVNALIVMYQSRGRLFGRE